MIPAASLLSMSQAFHVPAGLYARLPGTCFPPQACSVLPLHQAFFSCCGRIPHSKSRKLGAEWCLRSLPIDITRTMWVTGCVTDRLASSCFALFFLLQAETGCDQIAVLQFRVRKTSPASPWLRRLRGKASLERNAIGTRVASIQFAARRRPRSRLS